MIHRWVMVGALCGGLQQLEGCVPISAQIPNSDSARPMLTERAKERGDNTLRICLWLWAGVQVSGERLDQRSWGTLAAL